MRISSAIAVAVFVGLVPVAIWVAYLGFEAELYPRLAVPVVFGVLFAVAIAVVFAVLPAVRRSLD